MEFCDIGSVSGTAPHPTVRGTLAAIPTFCLSGALVAEISWLQFAPSVSPECAKEALMHLAAVIPHILSFQPALYISP